MKHVRGLDVSEASALGEDCAVLRQMESMIRNKVVKHPVFWGGIRSFAVIPLPWFVSTTTANVTERIVVMLTVVVVVVHA